MESKHNLLFKDARIMAQTLPNSPEVEKELLGQMILDNSIIDKVIHYIPSDTIFYNEFNRSVWRGIMGLRKNGTDDITINTLIAEIPPSYATREMAWDITSLCEIASTANCENNAKILHEKWLLRNIILKAEQVKNVLNVKNSDARQVLEQLQHEIEDVLDMQVGDGFDIDSLIDETVENMFDRDALIEFGYPELDELTGGMTRGEITVVAGRPGHFKSTTTLNLVRNIIHRGYKVLVMNREMSNVEMMKKLIVL